MESNNYSLLLNKPLPPPFFIGNSWEIDTLLGIRAPLLNRFLEFSTFFSNLMYEVMYEVIYEKRTFCPLSGTPVYQRLVYLKTISPWQVRV